MTEKHTRGPWQVNYRNPFQVCDADGELRGCAPIATMRGTAAQKRANARRIVACVNACEGIGTEDIEAGISLADLLEALKAISGGQVMREKELGYTHADVVVEYQRIASAAIAKATMTGPSIADLVESGALTQPPRMSEIIGDLRNECDELRAKLADSAKVFAMLIRVASAAWHAADDSEERVGDDGCEHVVQSNDFDDLSKALDALDELPDDRPGYVMNGPTKAEWALRDLLRPEA